MRARDLRLWITVFSLLVVAALVALDSERTSPGPLATAHASVEGLDGPKDCKRCHGGFTTGMSGACLECHGEIDDQLEGGVGLHGAATGFDASDCARCHSEHLGAEFELAGPRSFQLANLDRESFDHAHVEFTLTGAHARIECADCHANADAAVLHEGERRFLGLDQQCTTCHEDPHEGAFAKGCATCHGQEQPFAEFASFEHGDAFPLVGAHAEPECTECHLPGSPQAIEVVGGRGPFPPPRGCAICHESPHTGEFLAGFEGSAALTEDASCSLCHDAEGGAFEGASAEAELARRPELHAGSGFPLEGSHADVGCADCHGVAGAGEFADRFPGRASSSCESCHEDPHEGQFTERASCNDCHAVGEPFAPASFGVVDHERTAFPLADAHRELECSACHTPPAGRPDAPVVFAGTPTRCDACHEDAHGGAFVRPAVLARAVEAGFADSPSDCAACHRETSFDDVDEPAFDHELWTAFELEGAHGRAECSSCHPPAATPDDRGRRFGRAAPRFAAELPACAACHEDVHAGAFDGVTFVFGVAAEREGCARCHTTESFDDLEDQPFDHGAWTGFALDGAHRRAECVACHGEAPPAAGRTLGRVADRTPGPTERCETCHEDPHSGSFDGPLRPRVVDGREGCARCHTTEAFATFEDPDRVEASTFDHGLWTGYALEGAHAAASCTDCHARLLVPDARGRRLAEVPGVACSACHVNPHAGQLARDGVTDCTRCHQSDESFAVLAFDHDRDSRFALDEAHAALDCAACHIPWPLPDGRKVVRYKPLGTECIDCHDHGGTQGGRR